MYAQSYVPVSVYDSNIKSDSATSGQVLQADGNGGASWQTPSGSQLYMHSIRISYNDSYSKDYITTTIINNSNTAFTRSSLAQYLYNNGYRAYNGPLLQASGYDYFNNNVNAVVGLSSSDGTSSTSTCSQSNGNLGSVGLQNVTITDTIITL